MTIVDRQEFHKAIDAMTTEDLMELEVFMNYLRHKRTHPGSAWFRAIYDLFAPVREEVLQSGMTEDEINKIIDEAIAEVRRERKP